MNNNELVKHFPALAKHQALMQEIAQSSELYVFNEGDVLLREGAYVKVIPLLIKGLVKVYKEDDEGNEVLLYYIKEGESCIMSVTTCLSNQKSKVKAVVEAPSEILLLPGEKSIALGRNYPNWNEFMFDLFNSKYAELLEVISILTFSNKDSRLLAYLNKEAELKNSSILKTTHQKIADELGSSREVISRLLKRLEKDGRLKLGHGTIQLLH